MNEDMKKLMEVRASIKTVISIIKELELRLEELEVDEIILEDIVDRFNE